MSKANERWALLPAEGKAMFERQALEYQEERRGVQGTMVQDLLQSLREATAQVDKHRVRVAS